MKERTWPESSNVFSDLSKQYMTNNKPMVLNHNYKTKLTNQFFRLRQEYGFTRGKEKMISILSYVLEKELPKSGENIDTMMLFDKIQKIISDSLKSNNSGG